MLSLKNGTIQVADDKIVLVIKKDDYEEFKKYKNIDGDKNVIDEEFFASFTLNDKQIHITGFYPQGEQTNNSIVTVYASSIASNGTCHFECDNNGTYNSLQLQKIKDQLGLSENEVKVNISKHFVKELKDEIKTANAAVTKLEGEKTTLTNKIKDLEAQLNNRPDAAQLKDKDEKIKDLEAQLSNRPDAAQLKDKDEKIKDLEAQLSNRPDAAQLKDKDEKIKTANAAVTKLEGEKTTLTNKIKDLEAQLNNQPDAAQLKDKDEKIKELEAKINQPNAEVEGLKKDLKAKEKEVDKLKKENEELKTKFDAAEKEKKALEDTKEQAEKTLETKTQELETEKQKAENEKQNLQDQLNAAKAANPDTAMLQQLQDQLNTVKNEKQNLEAAKQKAEEALETKVQELETEKQKAGELNSANIDLGGQLIEVNSKVEKLTQENKKLEAKNKTTEQPKQSDAARYTATVGMGLAAGLVAFTALERTVRLEMLVMIGIAVASALVVGGITYAALPSTQVNGAEAQEVNGQRSK